jgi:hypothetical protein
MTILNVEFRTRNFECRSNSRAACRPIAEFVLFFIVRTSLFEIRYSKRVGVEETAEPFQFAPAELVVHVSELETTLQFEKQRPLLKSIGQMDGFQRRVIRWPAAA